MRKVIFGMLAMMSMEVAFADSDIDADIKNSVSGVTSARLGFTFALSFQASKNTYKPTATAYESKITNALLEPGFFLLFNPFHSVAEVEVDASYKWGAPDKIESDGNGGYTSPKHALESIPVTVGLLFRNGDHAFGVGAYKDVWAKVKYYEKPDTEVKAKVDGGVGAYGEYQRALSKGEAADSRSLIFFSRIYVGKIKLDGVKPIDDQYYGISIGLKG